MSSGQLWTNAPVEPARGARHERSVSAAEGEATRRSQEAESHQAPSHERTPCSVLIVDGSVAAREAIAELLREYGHSVRTAGCIREMERVCDELAAPPELAFLEFRLRDGRGDQAAAQLRARWPGVFILYFSCVQPEDDQALRSALLAPGTALLFKPTSLDAILQVVRKRPARVNDSK